MCCAALATLIRRLAWRTAGDSGSVGAEKAHSGRSTYRYTATKVRTTAQTTRSNRETPRLRRRASAAKCSISRSSAAVLRTVSKAASSAFFSGEAAFGGVEVSWLMTYSGCGSGLARRTLSGERALDLRRECPNVDGLRDVAVESRRECPFA